MKNLAKMAIVAGIAAFIGGSLNAQGQSKNKPGSLSTMAVISNQQGDPMMVNRRALKDFVATYKNVRGESWMTTRDGFAVRFNAEGTRNTVFYDRKGHWFGSIKNYSEDKLPATVRNIVKSQYYDYSIYNVEEVKSVLVPGSPTYIIHMEDKANIKLLRISDGEMEVWKEYKKA